MESTLLLQGGGKQRLRIVNVTHRRRIMDGKLHSPQGNLHAFVRKFETLYQLFLFLQCNLIMMNTLLIEIELTREFLLKFLKFGVVGFSGVFVNFGVTYACKEWLKWNKYLSNILGFIFAATTNYILNRLWTFQSTNPQIGAEYAKYFVISVVGLGIDTLTVYVLNGKLKWNFYLSKVFAVGAATFWNFFGNLLFTFA